LLNPEAWSNWEKIIVTELGQDRFRPALVSIMYSGMIDMILAVGDRGIGNAEKNIPDNSSLQSHFLFICWL
jgi:hypothetical protein